jgi:cell wall-associated NlpC family hydrolase
MATTVLTTAVGGTAQAATADNGTASVGAATASAASRSTVRAGSSGEAQSAAAQAAQAAAAQIGITQTGPLPAGRSRYAAATVPVAGRTAFPGTSAVAPLKKALQADLLVVAGSALPAKTAARIRRLGGVVAAQPVDAARIRVNGRLVAMLGVNPSSFRAFAARPTAKSNGLWQNVADGGIAVSYQMGQQERLPLGRSVRVAGVRTEKLRVGGFGTVGIAGVDAVVSDAVARSLGIPAGNAIVISAPRARLSTLTAKIKKLLPKGAAIAPLVAQTFSSGVAATSGAAGAASGTAVAGPALTRAEVARFITAAASRLGMPYVWGAAGPRAFDCSGLVQWSLAQAGVAMPRVAVDQARTGPQVPVGDLQPGDLLFYHTDPTAPTYISHVAIYVGDGMMIQAPEPGMDVELVPAIVGGPGFAGAVRVYPRLAAAVAANPAG